MNTHNYLSNEELQHIHRVLLKLLIDFDQLCKEQNIQYFLAGGSLLGAVRHQGFIPWDDDIDVMMLRDDYDRFCTIPSNKFPSHLFLQTYKTDKHYHSDMAKLRLNNTLYETEFSKDFPEMHNGFFIDIFVHDKTAKSYNLQKVHIFMTRLARSFVFHKWANTPMQFYGKYKICCTIAELIKKIIPIQIWESFREHILKYFRKSNSPYLYDGIGMHLSHGAFPENWLNGTIEISFEGHIFPAPIEYERYLNYSYGDYMKLPSESEKRFHKIHRIDFGEY